MEAIDATSLLSPSTGAQTTNSFSELGSSEFLSLLIAQLRNQDPLEPVGNAELLQQISSVRDIELSTTLTETLRSLTGGQRFASASSLIGQYVVGAPGAEGVVAQGLVVGIRFADGGQPILRLAGGGELPMDQLDTIESPVQAAEALTGQAVVGVDRRGSGASEVVEGVVTGVRVDALGEVVLELDSGRDLRFRDVVTVTSVDAIR